MTSLDHARRHLRAHPFALDAALAAAVLVCMVAGSFAGPGGAHGVSWAVREPATLSLDLMIVGAAALVFRRRAPRTVLAVTGAVSLIECVTGDPRTAVAMSAVVALFTVAAVTDRTTTWRLGLSTMLVLTGAAMFAGPLPWYAQENLGIFAWTGMAAAGGDAVRSRRAFVRAMRERAERAERTREEEARRRVAEERLRIARDLHDVVAHHIALVNVQAGVAAHIMDRRPDQAREALAHVREAGRSALNELRATVGLLRQSDDPEAPTEPAPGLDRLDELVGTFRSAGLHVEVACADDGAPLPAAVDLAAFRIVQEALTNVQKHAGTGARAEVSVVRVGPRIEITVLDDGASGATRPAPGTDEPVSAADGAPDPVPRTAPAPVHDDAPVPAGGHGLLGMRERVAALGGALTTGPRYGGGFRVHAILPATAHTHSPSRARTRTHDPARACTRTPAPEDAA